MSLWWFVVDLGKQLTAMTEERDQWKEIAHEWDREAAAFKRRTDDLEAQLLSRDARIAELRQHQELHDRIFERQKFLLNDKQQQIDTLTADLAREVGNVEAALQARDEYQQKWHDSAKDLARVTGERDGLKKVWEDRLDLMNQLTQAQQELEKWKLAAEHVARSHEEYEQELQMKLAQAAVKERA